MYIFGGFVKLEKKLGEGSFGIVYRVNCGSRKYAMKIEKKKGCLKDEISALKILSHPSIPPMLNLGLYHNYTFIILPLYKISLVQIMESNRSFFNSKTVAAIGWNLLGILEYIHSKNMIYRDVKPENIMLGFDDKIYLIDFGLCIAVENANKNRMVGTPRYVSRSIHSGSLPEAKDDLESLLYALILILTGTLPWSNETEIKKIRKMKNFIDFEGIFKKFDQCEFWIEFSKKIFSGCIKYSELKNYMINILKKSCERSNVSIFLSKWMLCCK